MYSTIEEKIEHLNTPLEWTDEMKAALDEMMIKFEEEMKKRPKTKIKNKDVYISDEIYDKIKFYADDWYVINSKNNVIKFSCKLSLREPIFIIVEWSNENDGKIIFCHYKRYEEDDDYFEKTIEYEKIQKLLDVLNKYDYLNKEYVRERKLYIGGCMMNLEVKIGDKFCEYTEISSEKGVFYEIEGLLLNYAQAKIKDYRER